MSNRVSFSPRKKKVVYMTGFILGTRDESSHIREELRVARVAFHPACSFGFFVLSVFSSRVDFLHGISHPSLVRDEIIRRGGKAGGEGVNSTRLQTM